MGKDICVRSEGAGSSIAVDELRAANAALETKLARFSQKVVRLRASNKRLREIARNLPADLWTIRPDGRILFHNKRRIGGRDLPKGGDGWAAMADPADLGTVRTKYAAAVNHRSSFCIQCRVRGPNGNTYWVLHSGVPQFIDRLFAGHVGTTIDITDLKRNYDETLAAEKLESLGGLSAGIAHDLNNLAAIIFAASDLALADLPRDSAAREYLERINAATVRASEIVEVLRAYAGQVDVQTDQIDLSVIVAEMLEMAKGKMPFGVALDVRLASGLPEIRANITQIRQVILNLLLNAFESLDPNGGTVRVSTDCVSLGRQRARPVPSEGDYNRLIISDTGCGVTGKARERIFDPFYSTKSIGRGLGLAFVHGVIRSIGGTVRVQTTPSGGTSFEVLLPRSTGKHTVRRAAAFSKIL